jgi:plastocyanin
MIKFRSMLLASTLAVVPALAYVVPMTAAAQEAAATQETGAKKTAAKKTSAKKKAEAKQEAAAKQAAEAKQEAAAKQEETGAVREIEIVVDRGYKPSFIEVTEGERIRLKFTRLDYTPCTEEVQIPSLNIRQALPTNKSVVVELPPLKAGDVEYTCGMNMVRGTLVVSPRS